MSQHLLHSVMAHIRKASFLVRGRKETGPPHFPPQLATLDPPNETNSIFWGAIPSLGSAGLSPPAPSPEWHSMWAMTAHGYQKSTRQELQILLEYLQSKLAGKHTFTSKESMQCISLSCEFTCTQKIQIRKLQVTLSSTDRFNWKISIMFCGLFFRKICVRKNRRGFFSPKKAANSFLGRPSEDRTAGQASTDFGQNWHCSTSSFGWARNAGLWTQSGNEFNCWELKSFHLATTSPIQSRWSRAKLIRRQNLCESCTAHCTASKLLLQLPAMPEKMQIQFF